MDLQLRASDEELKKKFFGLSSPEDVADLLEVEFKTLVYYLYRKLPTDNYKVFSLTKKSGGVRKIYAPISNLKILQRKLNYILSLVYNAKRSVHGFVNSKSILTNSQVHMKKYFILNIDLMDFFPTINFGRVRGMFMAYPYRIPPGAATVLSQICCFNNQLPQGAPTSPIVSNMICAKLDSELQKLAKKNFCTYTRYADDLTFSTTQKVFPKDLATVDNNEVIIGKVLYDIIYSNGFIINAKKTKLHCRTKARLEVTGLTVNEFPNVRRRFVRQIRAMLHAWEKYGLDKCQKDYNEKYSTKQRRPDKNLPRFDNVVKGKINFLRMVRGEEDLIYRTFAKRFNKLAGKGFPIYFNKPIEIISSAIWVLECEESCKQGTGFMLEGIGLVTCYHVLGPSTYAFKANDFTKYPVEILYKDEENDVVVLNINTDKTHCLKIGDSSTLEIGSKIAVAGYPNYNKGDTLYFAEGKITLFRYANKYRKFLIDASIVAGNSGGPVLNSNNEVVGIAVTGSDDFTCADKTEKHGVIPISIIDFLLHKE